MLVGLVGCGRWGKHILRDLCILEHLGAGPAPRSSAAEGAAVVEAIATLRQLGGAT